MTCSPSSSLRASSCGSSVESDKHNTMFPSRPHTNLPRNRQQYLTIQPALLSEQLRLMPSLKVADSLYTAQASLFRDERRDPMSKQLTVADYIVQRLAGEGITYCFG